MSRVEEALKRANEPSGSTVRALHLAGEPPGGPDELTIDHYPREAAGLAAAAWAGVARPRQDALARIAHPPAAAVVPESPAAHTAASAKLVAGGTGTIAAEQYRRIAATLHEAQSERGMKTILVTSAAPQEGKTLTVANLAVTLAESYGRRVLVIDADLRRPALHELFGLPNTEGLSEVLATDRTDVPVVRVSPALSVLPAGRPGPAPLAGLVSDRMVALLRECASQFDWVLLDAPPVGLLSDAQLLARLADAVVFVIAAGSTAFDVVERAVSDIGRDSIIGTVLNRVDERVIPAAGSYDRYLDSGD